jgi:hypothetical protein
MALFSRILVTAALATTLLTSASAQFVSLDTTYLGGNGQSGNMFDIDATEDIVLRALDVSIPAGSVGIEVYYSFGGYAGKTGALTNWTLIGSGNATGLGAGTPSPLPFTLNLPIPAGQKVGMYVTTSGGQTMDYTNGSTEGNLFVSDGVLSFYEGVGVVYPAAGTFSPRVWNGTLYYEIDGGTDQEGYLQTGVIKGNLEGGRLGTSLALMDDINADGVRDFALGNPGEFAGNGRVLVYGGKDTNKLVTIKGQTAGGALGSSVANVGDTSGMGTGPDSILAGAPGSQPGDVGEAHLYLSGATTPALSFFGVADDLFGSAVAGVGDVNGDLQTDVIIGAPGFDSGPIPNVGRFFVYSGETGVELRRGDSFGQDDRLGAAVTGLGDVDLDGVSDFAVGAPGAFKSGSGVVGRVEVWSGASLTKLYEVFGFLPDGDFGASLLDLGDITGDGKSDFAVGAPLEITNTGAVYVISGHAGEVLYRLEGTKPEGFFGTSLAMLDDTNGDGFMDFGAGAPALKGDWGYMKIYTADTGIEIAQLIQGSASTRFATSIASAGDSNEDGLADILVASPYEFFAGNKEAGALRIVTTLGTPSVTEATGVHVLDTGNYVISGTSLVGVTVFVDGLEVASNSITPAELQIPVLETMPGGFHDLRLETENGTITLPGFLPRYPALDAPETVTLGGEISIDIDNGEEGIYFLAWSGAKYNTPAPFNNFGWFHGLDLNGVWLFDQGAFTPGNTRVTLTNDAPSTPNLAGTVIYLQALTTQTALGYAGFTNSRSFTLVTSAP